MRFIAVIPARIGSTRIPEKPLSPIAGRPLIEWVYRRVSQARSLQQVVVATDDQRILKAVEGFGGKALLTSTDHLSGTDRVAEIARRLPADVYVNVQGDEPLISIRTIEAVCLPFRERSDLQVATARVEIREPEEIESPDAVKVVVDRFNRALYFSRATIPYRRKPGAPIYKHLGIYAYRREFLLTLDRLSPSLLEQAESLEQLRFLENGVEVHVAESADDSPGIDTLRDLERVRHLVENAGKEALVS